MPTVIKTVSKTWKFIHFSSHSLVEEENSDERKNNDVIDLGAYLLRSSHINGAQFFWYTLYKNE